MSDDAKLAESIALLAQSVRENTRLVAMLVDGLTPSAEAKLLGVSTRTVARRRSQRKMERLLTTAK